MKNQSNDLFDMFTYNLSNIIAIFVVFLALLNSNFLPIFCIILIQIFTNGSALFSDLIPYTSKKKLHL